MDYIGKMMGHDFPALTVNIIKGLLGFRDEVMDLQLSHSAGETYSDTYDPLCFP